KPEKPEKSEKAASPRRAERSGRRERAERPEKAERPAPKPEAVPFEPTDPETLGTEGRIAYDFLKNVTEKMGVPVAIRVTEEPDHLSVAMMGDTLGILIGRRGDTLDALQYLTSLQVNKHRDEYMRVSLDTENYRAKREEALTRLALRMAGRARKTGRKVTMEPMNPYERRVLHSALQGNPHVTTHSEGEEPYRRVVITLKNDDED
ncbi:MAG: protein jag, partial [Clostridia bacterium]|nr:protein jag [Clostridia bacterium]